MSDKTPDPISVLRTALAAAAEDLKQGAIATAPLIATPMGQQAMQALVELSKSVDNFIYWLDNPEAGVQQPPEGSPDPWQGKA